MNISARSEFIGGQKVSEKLFSRVGEHIEEWAPPAWAPATWATPTWAPPTTCEEISAISEAHSLRLFYQLFFMAFFFRFRNVFF